jgi:ABC-type antimicrobial peptide transport system permease subunit
VTIVSLLVAGVAASIVPALRAASVDPLKALRQD